MYTWVKRASDQEKREMQEVVDSYNELAHEHTDEQYIAYYRLERGHDSWVMVAYVDYAAEGFEDIYKPNDRRHAIGFVRCSLCGGIRELADGQIEFCTSCDADWTNPEKAQAARLWREYKENAAFWNRFELRGFKQKVTKLAQKVSVSDAPTVMYLDNLSLLLEMGSLEYGG